MKKRMAVCISAYEPGGQSVVLEETTKRFAKEYDIDLYCIFSSKLKPEWIKNLYHVKPWLNRYVPMINNVFIEQIKSRNYSVIHCHDSLPFLDSFCRNSIAYYVTCHGNTDWQYRDGIISKIDGILSLFFYRKPYKKAKKIVAISKYIQNWLWDKYGVDSVLIYNGVNFEKFKKLDRENRKADSPIMLYFGQLSFRKGIFDLLNAVKSLRIKYPDIVLQLGGFGERKFIEKIKAFAVRNKMKKNIILLGYVSDAEQSNYYNNCDVVVTASYWEGFGLPIVEAYSCNKPIFVRNCTAMKELVVDEGFRFNNVVELVHGVDYFFSNRKKSDSSGQFSFNADIFNWEYCCNKYLETFKT